MIYSLASKSYVICMNTRDKEHFRMTLQARILWIRYEISYRLVPELHLETLEALSPVLPHFRLSQNILVEIKCYARNICLDKITVWGDNWLSLTIVLSTEYTIKNIYRNKRISMGFSCLLFTSRIHFRSDLYTFFIVLFFAL